MSDSLKMAQVRYLYKKRRKSDISQERQSRMSLKNATSQISLLERCKSDISQKRCKSDISQKRRMSDVSQKRRKSDISLKRRKSDIRMSKTPQVGCLKNAASRISLLKRRKSDIPLKTLQVGYLSKIPQVRYLS